MRKELKSKLGIVASERAIHFVCGDFVSNEFSIDNNMIREILKYKLWYGFKSCTYTQLFHKVNPIQSKAVSFHYRKL